MAIVFWYRDLFLPSTRTVYAVCNSHNFSTSRVGLDPLLSLVRAVAAASGRRGPMAPRSCCIRRRSVCSARESGPVERSLSYNGSRSTRGRAEAAHEAASAAWPQVRPTRDTPHSTRVVNAPLHSTLLHIYGPLSAKCPFDWSGLSFHCMQSLQSVHWPGLSLHPAPEARDARPHLHGRSRPRARRLHIERSTAGAVALDPLPPGAQSCTCPSSTSSPPPLASCP